MTFFSDSELPPNWELLPISEVAEVNPKFDKRSIADDLEITFIPMPAVEAETGYIDVSGVRCFGEVKKGYTGFLEGDVLFAKITPCMENGKMAVVPTLKNSVGFGSTEFHVLRPGTNLDPKFLYYYVSSQQVRFDAEHNMSGAVGQKRVPTAYLAGYRIPVPSINQQKRIVSKIEEIYSELDKGIAALKAAREQLKVYRQSVLKHAVEGKITARWREKNATVSWRLEKLGNLLVLLTSGSRGWAKFYSDCGDTFIRAQNLKHDRLDLDEKTFVALPKKAEGRRTQVQVGDVLVTITGANVTKTGWVSADVGTAYVSQHVALCRPTEDINSEFLYWFLVAEAAGRKQLSKFAYGAGKPGLNLDNIRSVEISLPSLEEQYEIVNKLRELLSIEENVSSIIETELRRVELIRQSVLKKAFSGQLFPQDLNDEPASELLDRIRAETQKGKKTSRASAHRHGSSPRETT
ncbi:restriction endonuclease subunit S [Marinobacter sp. TBZ242]|uniref:Restriction endonuclease subunit S n=1 Tax=Marinobacter azerbaijanicus TaxID=3050455 RepID=A0ABT7IDV1_9GAMM|nr:restriction endonuclease subunit S [Marinobacter sp. TBZ242]MDL0432336.1 restriction endonuclease subunit S [Marinobacter sp. TBZ242]